MNKESPTPNVPALAEPSAAIIEVASKLPPRDLVAVEQKIREIAVSSGDMARSCIYCRPVGKDKKGRQNFAMGPSVRWTELAQQQFGRMWLNGAIVSDDKNVLTARCMCFDLQTLNITFAEDSKNVAGKNGRYSNTQIELSKSALLSICRRNAILQQTRAQYKSMEAEIKKAIIKDLCPDGTPEDKSLGAAWAELKQRYEEIGVDEQHMIMVAQGERSKIDGLIVLVGILNAINDGMVKAEEAFAGGPSKPATTAPKSRKQQQSAPKGAGSPEKPEPAQEQSGAQSPPETPTQEAPETPQEAPESTPAEEAPKDAPQEETAPEPAEEPQQQAEDTPQAVEEKPFVQQVLEIAAKMGRDPGPEVAAEFGFTSLDAVPPEQQGVVLKHFQELAGK